ncbi:MAG: hypothetical protein JNL01_12335 [Bdellovibrionales bacterium]|nr:hypothetical protein [Bdellovibrionales bacterium]
MNYKLADRWSVVALLEITKQLNGDGRTRIANPDVRLYRRAGEFGKSYSDPDGDGPGKAKERKAFGILLGPSVQLPANYDSIVNENFMFGLSASARLTFDTTPYGLKGFGGFYDLAIAKQFHRYDTSVDGRSLVPVKIKQSAIFGYDLTKRWSLFFTAGVSTGWTYNGHVTSSYGTSQEVDFQISEALQVGLGHQIADNLLSLNGQDFNFALYSTRASSIYISLNVTL